MPKTGSRRPASTTTTTTTTTTTVAPKRDEGEEEGTDDILFEGDQEELVIEDDEEELIEEEELPVPSSSTTTTTSTTSKPTTTTRPNRLAVTRRRPLNSQPVASQSTAIPIITSTPARAAIVIAIPAPLTRPIGDDFQKTSPSVAPSSAPNRQKQQPQSTLKRPQFQSAEQDDIDGDAEVIQGSPVGSNSAGNVVEIDEDGHVFCYDVGNFAYPEDCRRFVQCARPGDHEPTQGWVHTCPRALSFDPVGAICNWGSPVRCRQQS